MSEEKDDFGLPDIEYKPMDSNQYYEEEEEENSNSGWIITGIVGFVLFIGVLLAYKFVYVPAKERKKTVVEKPVEQPIQWIKEQMSQSGGVDRIGLITIEEHLYIATQSYGNGIRLVHAESCLNPKHITK